MSLSLVVLTALAHAPVPAGVARAQAIEHVRSVDPRLVEPAEKPWAELADDAGPAEVLAAAVQSWYVASEPTRGLVEAIGQAGRQLDLETINPLLQQLDAGSPQVATNVRAWLGRQLATAGALDEAALLLGPVDPGVAIDPAAALFFKAVCEHSGLEKEAGLETIRLLLEETDPVPERYRAVARLMRQDLEDLAENDMAKLAHQMKNVERRLQQGQSGEKTQEQEQRILSDLDGMIEQMQQQLQQMQGGGQGSQQPTEGMDDSRIAGQTAEGKVDKKPIGRTDGWGNLPDKERTAAKNLINRKFPSHYRQAVEEYLKRLAERPAK